MAHWKRKFMQHKEMLMDKKVLLFLCLRDISYGFVCSVPPWVSFSTGYINRCLFFFTYTQTDSFRMISYHR